jgi:Transposase
MGAMLAQQLVGAGEHVVDVPPKLSARVRLMDTGRIDKSDLNDARSAAIVALRNATLNTVTGEHEDRVVVRLLADRYRQLVAQRTRTVCRLHAVLCLLIEGGTGRHLNVAPATKLLASVPIGDPITVERIATCAQFVTEIGFLDQALAGNQLLFAKEGTIATDAVRVLSRTSRYDHCTMTVLDNTRQSTVDRFVELLLSMSYDDPDVRPLLQLEGLRQWRPGRTFGYEQLEGAVDRLRFYGPDGTILVEGYPT